MRIAILQYSPLLPSSTTSNSIAANFSRAESLLMREERAGALQNIDLLILPELAFTGYNHPSLSAIAPYLEPTADGPSTRWAIRTAGRLKCTVAVGYPEAAARVNTGGDADDDGGGNYNTAFDAKIKFDENTIAYNSLVFVNAEGEVVAHYRKSFLYYTDETWAKEGSGFYAGVVPIGNRGKRVKVAAGICMDINPHKFEAPWTAYEFANHARDARAKVIVLSMAWLTRLSALELFEEPTKPDMDTLGYWIERFRPLIEVSGPQEEVILVCANRTGDEGKSERIGDVRYAGSSTVMGLKKAEQGNSEVNVKIWDVMGRAQDGVMIVDTDAPAKYGVKTRTSQLGDDDDEVDAAIRAKETM